MVQHTIQAEVRSRVKKSEFTFSELIQAEQNMKTIPLVKGRRLFKGVDDEMKAFWTRVNEES